VSWPTPPRLSTIHLRGGGGKVARIPPNTRRGLKFRASFWRTCSASHFLPAGNLDLGIPVSRREKRAERMQIAQGLGKAIHRLIPIN